jgi:hypothetical protein
MLQETTNIAYRTGQVVCIAIAIPIVGHLVVAGAAIITVGCLLSAPTEYIITGNTTHTCNVIDKCFNQTL